MSEQNSYYGVHNNKRVNKQKNYVGALHLPIFLLLGSFKWRRVLFDFIESATEAETILGRSLTLAVKPSTSVSWTDLTKRIKERFAWLLRKGTFSLGLILIQFVRISRTRVAV